MNIFSLKTVKSDAGAVMQVRHPETEEPIEGMTITLLGHDSHVYRRITTQRQQAALNRMAHGKKATKLDAEKLTEDGINDLVELTVCWTGFDDADGKPMAFDPLYVKNIYTDPGLSWLVDQVRDFVGDRSNFLGN